MTANRTVRLQPHEAEELLKRAKQLLEDGYSGRTGFMIRDDYAIPEKDRQKKQVNLFVGSLAGLEVVYESKDGEESGTLSARRRCMLEYKLKAMVALVGFIVAAIVFCLLLLDGMIGNTFMAGSRWNATPHFNLGAVVVYSLLPALLAGFALGMLLWPLSLISRPFCERESRRENIVDPEAFLDKLLDGNPAR